MGMMDEKLSFFSKSLHNRPELKVVSVILFGSRARGDYQEGSDYDFAVIVKEKNQQIVEEIRAVEVEFLNRYNELSASLVYDESEWDKRKNLPIGLNIEREGIYL